MPWSSRASSARLSNGIGAGSKLSGSYAIASGSGLMWTGL